MYGLCIMTEHKNKHKQNIALHPQGHEEYEKNLDL